MRHFDDTAKDDNGRSDEVAVNSLNRRRVIERCTASIILIAFQSAMRRLTTMGMLGFSLMVLQRRVRPKCDI